MTRLRTRRLVTTLLTAAALVIGVPAAASAAAPADKPQVMSAWTQPTAASQSAWNAARLNQAAWAAYQFDWTTDYCTTSPDEPLGFDFRLPCQRHDWGYRNYRAIGDFDANKSRIDNAFYFDLQRVCDTYASWQQPACDALAWSYYQAVSVFGSLAAVSDADLKAAQRTLDSAAAR